MAFASADMLCSPPTFVQVDLSSLLPPEALAAFADELGARERRRKRRAAQSRRAAEKEAADARAAEMAKRGPSVQELQVSCWTQCRRLGFQGC